MRTEEEILQDFKKLGYTGINYNKPLYVEIEKEKDEVYLIININEDKGVTKYYAFGWDDICEKITLEEFKLLHELFKCWGWL